jgi:N,N-dimethylformamidase
MAKLMVGYSDRLSVAAGEQQSFMVSANIAGPYNASLVAVIGGGTRVDGIGFREREIEWLHSGVYIGEPRTCHPGSYGLVDNVPAVDGTGTIGVFFKPTLLGKAEQTILDVGTGALVVTVNDVGLNVGTANEPSACLPVVLNAWHWVLIRIGCNTLNVLLRRFGTSPNEPRTEHELRRPWRERVGAGRLSIGASVVESQHGLRPRAAFNGRIELPWLAGTVLDDEQAERLASGKASFEGLIAAWDFSIAISSDRIVDASGNNLDGRLFNTPTRGVRGIRWDGSEHDWRKQPSQYGAIHFHSEALTDAAWPPDICWTVPEHLASGVYAVKLTQGDAECYIPIFVRASQQRAKIVFIAATATYLAYANSWFSTSASVIAKRPLSPGDEYLQQHPELAFRCTNSTRTAAVYIIPLIFVLLLISGPSTEADASPPTPTSSLGSITSASILTC